MLAVIQSGGTHWLITADFNVCFSHFSYSCFTFAIKVSPPSWNPAVWSLSIISAFLLPLPPAARLCRRTGGLRSSCRWVDDRKALRWSWALGVLWCRMEPCWAAWRTHSRTTLKGRKEMFYLTTHSYIF